MKEKTLGKAAVEAYDRYDPKAKYEGDLWDYVAAAVVAEHELQKWRPITTLPLDGRVIVGYWKGKEWVQCMGMAYMLVNFRQYTHWHPAPEGPK